MTAFSDEPNLELITGQIPIPFKTDQLIGKGGQKLVFSGVRTDTQERLVLKVIKTTSDSRERTIREIRAASIVNHANIPGVICSNAEDVQAGGEQVVWVVEQYVPGESLRAILDRGPRMNLEQVVRFVDTMLDILLECEKCKIVHRDVKPENIMVDPSGDYWLIDFGISRHLDLESLTHSQSPFGPCTIGYSAGEQFRNRKREIDIRADLFSVGVIAAEMLCGYNPYVKDTQDVLQVIKKIESQPLPVLRIEGDERFFFARLIKSLGDNRISRRPRTVVEAKEVLELVKKSLG